MKSDMTSDKWMAWGTGTRGEMLDKHDTQRVTLTGEVTANLTAEEQTEWSEFCLSIPDHDRLLVAQSNLRTAESVGAWNQIAPLVRDLTQQVAVLHKIAHTWVADLRARQRAEAEKAEAEGQEK